jgi:hypothetical protein
MEYSFDDRAQTAEGLSAVRLYAIDVAGDAGVTVEYVPRHATVSRIAIRVGATETDLLWGGDRLHEASAGGPLAGAALFTPIGRFSRGFQLPGDQWINLSKLSGLRPDGLANWIHGVPLASDWFTEVWRDPRGAHMRAWLDSERHEPLRTLFGGASARLEVTLSLMNGQLRNVTTVTPRNGRFPVQFGWRPCFTNLGGPLDTWHADLGVGLQYQFDRSMMPTGEIERVEIPAGPLGDRALDSLFVVPARGSASIAGSDWDVMVELIGYPCMYVWASRERQLVTLEPMTGQTDALFAGKGAMVDADTPYEATWTLSIDRPAGAVSAVP